MAEQSVVTASTTSTAARQYRVSHSDLPLACPNRLVGDGVAHPRVFLEFDIEGRAVCPYCGTEYLLEE